MSKNIVKAIQVATVWSMILVVCIACITVLYLGDDYNLVIIYFFIAIWGGGAQSLYTPYNFWLNSHGHMCELRNAAFKICLYNLFLGVSLTWIFSAYGTAMAFTIGYIYAFYLYRKIYFKKQYKEC